jgi:hypothetical protein
MAKYRFDFSNMTAADYTAILEISLRLRVLEQNAQSVDNLFGTEVSMSVDSLDATAVLLQIVQFAGRFTDGYTLRQVPYDDLRSFLDEFSVAFNEYTAEHKPG